MADIVDFPPGHGAEALVEVQEGPGITRIVLSSPPANLLSVEMIEALLESLDRCARAEDCRVVVLAAKGETFCGGHDLLELTARRGDPDEGRAFFERTADLTSRLVQTIAGLPQPVIAEVGGFATAAGCLLVAACDLAVASEEAQFHLPGVHIGLFCSLPMVAISRTMGPKQAMEMALTGERIDARTAREFGLVNRVVPPEYLGTIIGKYATAIAAKPAQTVRSGKAGFRRRQAMGLGEAYDDAARAMVDGLLSDEGRSGIAAFLESRRP